MDYSSFFEDHGDVQVEMAYTTLEPTFDSILDPAYIIASNPGGGQDLAHNTAESDQDVVHDFNYTCAAAAPETIPRVFTNSTPKYPMGYQAPKLANIGPIPTDHPNATTPSRQLQILQNFDAKQHARLASGIDASLYKSFQKLAALLKLHNDLDNSDPPDVEGAKELAKRIDKAVKDSEVDGQGNLVLKGKKRN